MPRKISTGPRHLPQGNVEALGVEPEQLRQTREVHPAEGSENAMIWKRELIATNSAVASSSALPRSRRDEDHRDAVREADDDQAGAVLGKVGEQQPTRENITSGPTTQLSGNERTGAARAGDAARARCSGPSRGPGTSSAAAPARSAARPSRLRGVERVARPGTSEPSARPPGHRDRDPQRQEGGHPASRGARRRRSPGRRRRRSPGSPGERAVDPSAAFVP